MKIYSAIDAKGRPFDFFDSYESMTFALMHNDNFCKFNSIEVPDDEAETVNKYLLAKNRLVYLTQKYLNTAKEMDNA